MTATVTPITAVPKKRSNRALTQFACLQVERFLSKPPVDDYQLEEKNTAVRFIRDGNLGVITVLLYGEEILRLTLVDDKALTVTVSFTSFFDSYGQPTTTTSERLNGLLDCLGWLKVLPHGVRLFRGAHDTTYLGRGDEKVAVGEDFFRSVYIKPNHERLKFAGFSTEGPSGVVES